MLIVIILATVSAVLLYGVFFTPLKSSENPVNLPEMIGVVDQIQSKSRSPAKLSVNMTVKKNPIIIGEDQTVIVYVTSDGVPVANATISGAFGYEEFLPLPRGQAPIVVREVNGVTDSSGKWVSSWKIGNGSTPGIASIKLTVSKAGYIPAEETITFQLIRQR